MAAFTSSRWPTSSRQTMPISSVTLAWRMLVVTLNLWPTSQMNGFLMSLGGYISHNRCCVGEVPFVAGIFFLGVAINFGISDLRFKISLAARDGGDDADFVAVFERRLAVLEEADVLLVDIDVHEAADFAFVVHQALGDAGEARLQFDDRLADGGGVDFDQLLVVGQLAERRGDADFFWHKLNFNFSLRLNFWYSVILQAVVLC